MAEYSNAMEVFKLLEKTNCRQCNKPTCLAFAAAVFQGQASLDECPFIDSTTLENKSLKNSGYQCPFERDFSNELVRLKEEIQNIDLEPRAPIIRGVYENERLSLKILGKDFSIDQQGNIFTLLHVNSWLTLPVLHYIISAKGVPPTNNWIPFRELATSKDWARFFEHQTGGLIKKIADSSPSFFEDIIELFNGTPVENHYDADIALILKPLPLLPILFCYNEPEDGMVSDLNIFFDTTADQNLPVEAIYTLTTGLGNMFEKIANTHGFK